MTKIKTGKLLASLTFSLSSLFRCIRYAFSKQTMFSEATGHSESQNHNKVDAKSALLHNIFTAVTYHFE